MPAVNTVKMVCSDIDCINKSIVYRKLDGIRQNTCKACGGELVKAKVQNTIALKQDIKAKKELKELGSL